MRNALSKEICRHPDTDERNEVSTAVPTFGVVHVLF